MGTLKTLPDGACDTHIHFYDARFPSSPDAVLHPPDAGVEQYIAVQAELGLSRLVVVQPTTYGIDNACQLAAMARFGDRARGVMVVDSRTPLAELHRLDDLGVRGARFHMLPGGAIPWDDLPVVARRISELGWHVQLQLNGRELADRFESLRSLPCSLVVDHVGRFMPPVAADHDAFLALLRLVELGRTWVKLSAPYESSELAPPHADVGVLAERLLAAAPERMLWASNWPHPGQRVPPTTGDIAALLAAWLPEHLEQLVLVDNPAALYGFTATAQVPGTSTS